ncbi:MAG TPA: ATP-binding protein [Polyangiaceae bacterium]|nr:ATP-binding protein [Polyangiaceae bacterium]
MVSLSKPAVDAAPTPPALVDALRTTNVGIVVAVENDGSYLCDFVNERAKDLLGRVPRLIPSELGLDGAATSALAQWLAAPLEMPFASDACVAAGAARAFRIVGSRSRAGGRAAAVLFLYDAAPETHAERALAESEARFRRLLDAAPGAIGLGTRERFLYANPASVRLLGYSTMEEVTSIPLRQHVHPDDRQLARRIVQLLMSTRTPVPETRIRLLHKDGRDVPVDLHSLVIEFGGEKALFGVAHDLSERRRVQAQLVRADRLSSVGTLAAGVAHEINNPLAYLMLNLQYLMRELPRFDGDETRLGGLLERLAEAEHGARRVSTIVGDLRTLARPEETNREPVSVPKALTAAIKVAGVEMRRRARVVEVYENVPHVDASPTRLEQVFVNLLVNAGHAIKEGRPEDNEIRVTAFGDAGRVVVEVSDTGSGIAPETLGRVFDPFFTTKPRGLGTGLGLPISRGIVKSLGGEITVTSVIGTGTTFRVTLPALADDDPRLKRAAEEALPSTVGLPVESAARRARARVLVVDDEPLVADMLRRTLADGHDVTVATDARTALDFVLSGAEFDLIFCDLLMPRMSGMDLYTALRAERPGVEERIVFMTGGAFTERAAAFLATVPNRKMSKPFDLTELERVVSKAARNDG